jgi:hypothetical protein
MARPSQCEACGCFEACLFPDAERCAEREAKLQADFQRRKTGADSREGEAWPWPVEPHVFVPWPNHVACAWCCGAVSNKHFHIKTKVVV